MKASFWIAIALIILGIVLVMLPDSGPRIIKFNENHGPSVSDLVGLTLIIIVWIYFVSQGFKNRRQVSRRVIIAIVVGVVLGAIGIASGLQLKNDELLWSGVFISVLAYGVFIVPAFKKE